MPAIHLPPAIEKRLEALAKKTGRTIGQLACDAVVGQIEDIEDYYLARRRLARGGLRVTLESLERPRRKRAAR
jgi:RHH-type rel operon transcriptional repressor/antitoxin RelB